MTSPSRRTLPTSAFSRRTALRGAAALATSATLGTGPIKALAAQPATPADQAVTIPPPIAGFPEDDVTFRMVDPGDSRTFFWNEFIPAYQAARGNVEIDYQGLPWNEIQKVVPLGIRNNNAPDMFMIPLNVPAALAAGEGWGMAFDDIIPDFDAYKARFPSGTFVPGITDFGGKTYTAPLVSNRRHGSLLLYNRQYLDQAGLDPSEQPFTFDQFREAAVTLTQQGNGDYYGMVFEGNQVNRFANFVNTMAQTAGLSFSGLSGGAPFDWATGEFLFTSDEHAAALELLLALRDDNVFLPGSTSLNAPEARARMPLGQAAMIIQGPWNINQWRTQDPEFDFGVAAPPVSTADQPGYIHIPPGGDGQFWVFSGTKHPEVAADILSYLGSVQGQIDWTRLVGVGDRGIFPESAEAVADDPEAVKALEIFDATLRRAPDVRVRKEDASAVFEEIQPVQPGFGPVVQGIFSGQIDDAAQAMQDLQDAWNAELDRAIGAANDAGAEISRDDFAFPNWDPAKDYGEEDYAAL